MSKEAFSIFDILREQGVLKEAEENENTPDEASTTNAIEDNEVDNNTDDFDIDASLDNEENDEGEDINTDSSPSESDSSGDTDTTDGDEEVNDDNTDIFSSLSAEEQQIKIKELKGLFQNMYTSCDEILDRINSIEFTEDSLAIMTRITYSLYDLKNYISEYIISIFPRKSYIENDITFNRFLMILNSIKDILVRYQKKVEKDS